MMPFTEEMLQDNPWWAAWRNVMNGPSLTVPGERKNPITKTKQPSRPNKAGWGLVVISGWGPWVGTCPKCFYRKEGFRTRKTAKDWLHVHRGFYCDKSKNYPRVK